MSENELYADSAQARALDRSMEAGFEAESEDDWSYGAAEFTRICRESAERTRARGREAVAKAMGQIESRWGRPAEIISSTTGAQHGARGVVMSEAKELAAVPPAETALQVFTTEKGLEPWLQQVRVKVDEFKKALPELATQKGRDRYASMAHQIAKSKTALEAVGKELSAKQKELPKKIDAERKRVWDILESWQKEVRQPLDDWQKAEDARIDRHKDAIARIKLLASDLEGIIADDLEGRIGLVEATALGDQWQEFEAEAGRAKDEALKTLRDTLIVRKKHEAELAEIARFNSEKAERERAEHEEAIARAAEERAKQEAEQRAQAEREAAAQRERALVEAADREKREAENQRLQLELQAQQAERARIEAEQRAEQERIAAERRQAEAVEGAKLDEQRRQKAAAEEILRQEKLREADKAHKTKVNRAALDAFIAGGMPEDCAKQAVILIAQRKIPAVSISY